MKKILFFLPMLYCAFAFTQPNTEIYLVDIDAASDKLQLKDLRNISNNEGYDNQPSFYNDNYILFSSTRHGQTDIAAYRINKDSLEWLTNTPDGSEYSPLKVPGKKAFSSIRLDKDGTQLLHRYEVTNDKSKVLLEDQKVGYHVWYSKNVLVTTVLIENRMDLVVSNLKDGTNYTHQKNVGRSLHRIPNSDRVSFIGIENGNSEIKSLHPVTGATEKIAALPPGVEDICWFPNGTILAGQGNKLMQLKPGTDQDWTLFHRFEDSRIDKITRLTPNSIASKLAFVAEASPELVVQEQLDAYNARDIDAFVATYTDDVKLYNYPNTLFSEGKEKLREQYGGFFDATPDLNAEIKNRIVIGNKVIDEELVTVNGRQFNAVAIYELNNGKISKVTFIQ